MLNGTQVGPYKLEDVQGWISAGYVKMDDPAWYEGCQDWITVMDIPGIQEISGGHIVGGHLVPPFEAYTGDEPYVFISYAHKDSEFVFEEISILHEAGYHIWYDEGIEASNEWPEEIANAVIGCAAFLVFVSPRSTASVNCRNEINLALNENKPFLAVHMEESALPPGLRLRMGDLQAILKYKLPQDRYKKKLHDTLDQLLGKKKKKARPESSSPTTFAQTSGTGQVSSRPRKKKLATSRQTTVVRPAAKSKMPMVLGLMVALLIGVFGTYQFLEMKQVGFDEIIPGINEADQGSAELTEGKSWSSLSTGMEMIWCKQGTFMMGSSNDETGRGQDESHHQVTFSNGFLMGKYEVTQAQFKEVMGSNPSSFSGVNMPVEMVTWSLAVEFCKELTKQERNMDQIPLGWTYHLPTEAQWEYACRAGTETSYSFGNKILPTDARWSDGKSPSQSSEVGRYPSNPWGFHDMHGNVWEWCSDWYGEYPSTVAIDPIGPTAGTKRVRRGGSWLNPAILLRSAWRFESAPSDVYSYVGFRACLSKRK